MILLVMEGMAHGIGGMVASFGHDL